MNFTKHLFIYSTIRIIVGIINLTNSIDANVFLKVLSNPHRRAILKLLSASDRYAYELAKLVNITPRAVANHLEQLHNNGLVYSESRKSNVGPNREYFSLNKGFVFRISIGQNLYYTKISNLSDDEELPISPKLQLNAPAEKSSLSEILEEGLDFLPQIRKELKILELQQVRLLRKYQGMLLHLGELLTNFGLEQPEIELLLELIERDGNATQNELLNTLTLTPVTLSPIIESLMDKKIINHNIIVEDGKPPINEYRLLLNPVTQI